MGAAAYTKDGVAFNCTAGSCGKTRQIDRFNPVIGVIDRVPGLQMAGAHVKELMKNQIIENLDYAYKEGFDKPAFNNWKWSKYRDVICVVRIELKEINYER